MKRVLMLLACPVLSKVKVPAALVHAAFMAGLQFGYAKVVSTDEYLA
nr:hypothetical protein [Pseudomonas gingeri]